MNKNYHTFIDTDLFIHRLDTDEAIKSAAQYVFDNNHPSAMASFSLVEFKGNYIQDLILLHRKISDSDSLKRAYSRIRSTGGHRAQLMLTILISWINDFSQHPWSEARRELLTYLDTQIIISWEEFKRSVDLICDDLSCVRASENPDDDGEKWTVIHNCNENNTKCKIIEFMESFRTDLVKLIDKLNNLDSSLMTKELYKIRKVAGQTISKEFPWQENTCRQVGDLLIGLQSKIGQKLISSNYKEHSQLCGPLGYSFEEFPIAKIRSK